MRKSIQPVSTLMKKGQEKKELWWKESNDNFLDDFDQFSDFYFSMLE